MLKIKNLTAVSEAKELLKDINLTVKAGEIHAVMGPKFSGKSALAHTISGHPYVIVNEGQIKFHGKNIHTAEADVRYKAGIFTAFQYPPEYDGLTNWQIAETVITNKDPKIKDLQLKYTTCIELLSLGDGHGSKAVTGSAMTMSEAKRNEIVLMLLSDPDLVVLDEIDQGLEDEEIVLVATLIRDYIKDNDKACIVITHSHLLLKLLDPSHVHVMIDGEIKLSGGEELHKRIVEDGYPEFS